MVGVEDTSTGVVALEVHCGAGPKGLTDGVPVRAEGYSYSFESGFRHRAENQGGQTGWIAISGNIGFVIRGLNPEARYDLEFEAEFFGSMTGTSLEVYAGGKSVVQEWDGRRRRIEVDLDAYAGGELYVRVEPAQVFAAIQVWKLIWKGGGTLPVVAQPLEVPSGPSTSGLVALQPGTARACVRLKGFRDTVAIARIDGKEYQVLIAELENPGPETRVVARVTADGSSSMLALRLEPGLSFHEIHVPVSPEPREVTLEVLVGEQVAGSMATRANPPERYEIHLAPGTHMDFGWMVPGSRANLLYKEYMDTAIKMIQTDPAYAWTAESVSVVKDYLCTHPDAAETIKGYLKDGRLEITANWLIPTTMTFDGEAILRQVAYPVAWLDRNLSYRPTVSHFYDVGDHTHQMPQFLAGAGVLGYVWNLGQLDLKAYRWVSPDGSSVVAFKASGYSEGFNLFQGVLGEKTYGHRGVSMVHNVSDWIESEIQALSSSLDEPLRILYVPMERDVSPPRRVDLEIVAEWNRRYSSPKIIFSTPSRYLSILTGKVRAELPAFEGQVSPPPPQWRGHLDFTQRAEGQIKALHELLNAERFASLACILGGIPAPAKKIEEAWEGLLYTQDHNYAMAPFVAKGAEDEDVRYKEGLISKAHSVSCEVIQASLGEIVGAIGYKGTGEPIVVFNPLSWDREEVVGIPVGNANIQGFDIVDSSGKPVSYQIDPKAGPKARMVYFKAAVPSFGYTTYYLKDLPASGKVGKGSGSPLRIENEFYRIEIDRATGFVKTILDKDLKCELLSDSGPMGLEIGIQFGGDENPRFDPASSLAEDIQAEMGPVMERAVIRGRTIVRGQGGAGAGTNDKVIRWSRTLSLYKGLKKIAVESSFDWDDGLFALILEALPFSGKEARFTYEVPYGVTTSGGEVSDLTPVQKWVGLYDEANGTGIAVASDWMRWRGRGSSLFAVTQSWGKSHYSIWDGEGPSNIRHYTITSYKGDWQENKVYRMGWENVTPLIPVYQGAGCERSTGQFPIKKLPEGVSFLTIDTPNVIVSAVKPSWNSEDTILRLCEAQGKPARVALHISPELFPEPGQVLETGMAEDAGAARKINIHAIDMKPFEVKTLRLRYR